MNNTIILRIANSPYNNDITRNSVLSHYDVDNNFLNLKGLNKQDFKFQLLK